MSADVAGASGFSLREKFCVVTLNFIQRALSELNCVFFFIFVALHRVVLTMRRRRTTFAAAFAKNKERRKKKKTRG